MSCKVVTPTLIVVLALCFALASAAGTLGDSTILLFCSSRVASVRQSAIQKLTCDLLQAT